jgi:hypothetical protein
LEILSFAPIIKMVAGRGTTLNVRGMPQISVQSLWQAANQKILNTQ